MYDGSKLKTNKAKAHMYFLVKVKTNNPSEASQETNSALKSITLSIAGLLPQTVSISC